MMEKTLISNLVTLFQAYEAATGIPPGGVARRALHDNTWASKVMAGANFTIQSYDRIVVWMAKNWPPGVAWPEHVPLPDGFSFRQAEVVEAPIQAKES